MGTATAHYHIYESTGPGDTVYERIAIVTDILHADGGSGDEDDADADVGLPQDFFRRASEREIAKVGEVEIAGDTEMLDDYFDVRTPQLGGL